MEGYDDGYTGTNFERPCFKEMLEAVKEQKVNCVIVKDLSRFGREYIEAGRYIEKLFPAWACALSPSTTVMIPPIWTLQQPDPALQKSDQRLLLPGYVHQGTQPL